ncbi:MAG: phosphate regulon sensor histidine kinase PhoR [Gammaproteobacteria bacterium]|nr:MAG: phosphate regulon sensor histidine kinase PhoR [Gammaproteobacteria bacterium]
MSNPWQRELWRILGLVLAGLVLGVLAGNLALGLLAILVLYTGWHLYNIHLLIRWLHEGRKFRPPEARGIWDDVFENIFRLQQRNRKRKRELRSMLKRFHKITVALPDATVELRSGSDQIEWWNNAAAKYLGFESPRDNGQRISNLLRHPAFVEYLHKGDYDQAIEIPSPVDESITLRIRVIPYSGNRRLVLARDMTRMQKLERMRQDFVANVSHELRSPLTVVSGYLETLMDAGAVETEFADQLESMQQQTERMNRIVDDLMLLSRLENEVPHADQQAVPVARLIDSIIDQGRVLSGTAEHTIVSDVDDALCIKGAESELYSAFSNLVFNAIRYTPAGGHISICWKLIDGEPVFSVEDSGAGIEAHHIPRLTERFYRIDTGRSRATGGTGLGLAIVKHVLLRHEGELEIDSEPGRGSCFRCRFPGNRYIDCKESKAGAA